MLTHRGKQEDTALRRPGRGGKSCPSAALLGAGVMGRNLLLLPAEPLQPFR